MISSVKLIESVKLQLSSNDEKPISSKLQSEVTTYLRYLFPEIVWEEEYFMIFTSLDIAYPEKKLVLQVNGPSHYEGRELNPSTQFNNYLLEKEEWKLVTIPYFEWDLLKTHSKKNAYIKKKLKPYSIQNNSENSIMYHTSKEAKLTMRQCDQATVNKNTSVYDRCASTGKSRNLPQYPHNAKNNRKKPKQPKRLIPLPDTVWDNIIQSNLKEKIRPDELQKAYEIFEFTYQTLIKENKTKKDLNLFRQLVKNKLESATYQKKYELLSCRTILSFFKGEPYRYGLRFNKKTHPKEAFTENVIKNCIQ